MDVELFVVSGLFIVCIGVFVPFMLYHAICMSVSVISVISVIVSVVYVLLFSGLSICIFGASFGCIVLVIVLLFFSLK